MSNLKPLSINILQAKSWARKWQIECPNNCKAFLMPVDDLITCLEEMEVLTGDGRGNYTLDNTKKSGIRAYMAINPEIEEGNGEKLLLVGTKLDSNGIHRDIIRGEIVAKVPREDELNSQVSKLIGSGVYDFTVPCPNTCDESSPLI